MNNLKVAVFGFSPHAHGAGVFAKKKSAFSHLIQRLGPTKEVVARRTRQPDYNALSLSLSHRSSNVGLLYSPWWHRSSRTRGAYVPDREAVLRQNGGILNIPMVDRVVDRSLAIS